MFILALCLLIGSAASQKLCLWASGCGITTDCASGSICSHQSQYFSQCIPDPSCVANGKWSGVLGPSGCCSGTINRSGVCVAAPAGSQTCVYTKALTCWKQAFAMNTVYLNTLSGPNGNTPNSHAQMGYISQIFDDNYPAEILNGQPVVTPQYAKDLCDALTPAFCGAVQIFLAPTENFSTYSLQPNWINLLTPLEFSTYKSSPQTLPNTTPVIGYAYERVPC